jgi:C-terminal processing protease CtpA/Prc
VDVLAKFIQKKRVTDLTGADGASDIWDRIRELEGEEHLMRLRYIEKGDELMILKIPSFNFDMEDAYKIASKAHNHQALIIDLRGNPGGAVDSLKYLLSKIFDRDVKIGDREGRKEQKPEIAKTNGHDSFAGKLIVLIDSRSASAAELFARLIQLEKRGVVIGDRSSGSVMEAKHYSLHLGADTEIFYGASITESDLIMSDGKSLEHVGVTPDEVVLPTASDLANGLDPVLARAASLAGVKLSPAEAGRMFPYEWPAP